MSGHPDLVAALEAGDLGALQHADGCAPCRAALLERDAFPAGCAAPSAGAAVLLALDLVARGDPPPELAAHLQECPACAAEAADAAAALGEVGGPEGLRGLAGPSGREPAVVVRCVFCHDAAPRAVSVYCARCLAPHHAGCFSEHGRCAVLGCEEEAFVRPERPPARRRGRRAWWVAAGALALGAGAVAALREPQETSLLPAPPAPAQPAPPPHVEDDPVVARVNGQALLRSELEQACSLRPEYAELPREARPARLRIEREELAVLLEERVLLALAGEEEDAGEGELEADARGTRLEVPAAYGGVWGLLTARERGLDEGYLRARIRGWERIERLLASRVVVAEVTDAEVRARYEAGRGRYHTPGETRIRELVLFPSQADARRSAPAVEELVRTSGRWDAGAFAGRLARERPWTRRSFEEVAREASMLGAGEVIALPSADPREVLVPPLDEAVARLEPGQVAGPLVAYTGSIHVIQLVARQPAVHRPLSEVADAIRAELTAERREERRRAWIRERLQEAEIEWFLSTPSK